MTTSTSSSATPSGRLEFLDGLRAIAALLVIVHHGQLEVWPTTSSLTLYLGRLCVDVFIVLSGFCLMLPVARSGNGQLRGGALRFLTRRAQRILPPYYAAVGLSLVLIWTAIGHKTGAHWDVSVPVTTHGIGVHMMLLQDVLHRGEINHPLWSVAVEWKIYLLFPLLLLAWARLGAGLTTVLTVAGALAVFVALQGTDLLGLTPHYLGLFTLGVLAASLTFAKGGALARARQVVPWRGLVLALVALVLALVGLGWGVSLSSLECAVLDTLVGATTAAALVVMALRPEGALHRAVSVDPLVKIGGFSYSLYLVHAPLQHFIWLYALGPLHLHHAATFALLVVVGLPVLVAAAYLFYRVFEKPFMPGTEGSIWGRILPGPPNAAAPRG